MHTHCLMPNEMHLLRDVTNTADLFSLKPEAYRPRKPPSWKSDPDAWLSNHDIDQVLKQYEKVDKNFVFLGSFPVDFQLEKKGGGGCMFGNLCRFVPSHPKFAMVINTDTHDGPGKHWMALFYDESKGAFFYNSTGNPPPDRVKHFMMQLRTRSVAAGTAKSFVCRHNRVRAQRHNSECGLFSILFVVRMLTDGAEHFDRICREMEGDAMVARYRNLFWNEL